MAIEFNCPYCTSTIRVKDGAAGKRGRCPRCEEQLLVPKVQPFAPTTAPSAPSVTAAAPQASMAPPAPVVARQPVALSQAAPPTMEPADAAPFPNIVIDPAAAPVVSSASTGRARSRRKSGGPLAMTILGVCFVLILGLAGSLWWSSQPVRLEGTLAGELVSASSVKPARVPTSGASDKNKTSVLAALRELPYSMKSSLLVTEFRGTASDLEVRLLPTTTTSIVRVSPQANENLAAWLTENQSHIAAQRQADVGEAVEQFFADYAAFQANGTSMRDKSPYYRNRLGLGVMSQSLGYVVEATTEKQVCPCIFEDPAGNLYFAVPTGTPSFTVRGRTMDDGRKLFPGTFTVSCGAAPEAIELVEPTTPEPMTPTPPSEEPAAPESLTTDAAEPVPASGTKSEPADKKMEASGEPDFEMESEPEMKPEQPAGSGTTNPPSGSGSAFGSDSIN